LPSYGKSLLILAGLGLAWSILRARWFGLTLALWVSFLFLLANPGKIPMPGGGLNNTSVEIMLFIPISILGGYLVGSAIEAGGKLFTSPLRIPYYALIGIAGALLALLGARTLLPILNPITMLIREADKPALAWIQENIPQNESILINPFLWGYGIYAGQDGGYWLGPLGGHKTLPPPVLYYMAGPKVTSQINDISRQVIADSKDPVRLAALMQAQGLHYIFIGARGGVLSARTLQESPLFDLIYNQNGTWLFELKQAASK